MSGANVTGPALPRPGGSKIDQKGAQGAARAAHARLPRKANLEPKPEPNLELESTGRRLLEDGQLYDK